MQPLRFLPYRIDSFLTVTIVVAIAISSPKATKNLTAQEIALLKTPTAALFDSPCSNGGRNILVSQNEDPLPPRPSEPGGSR